MKTWYFAKCATCMEVRNVMVSNPTCSAVLLEDKSQDIQQWLEKHYGCELTLGWRDDHLDKLWEEGYVNKDLI